MRKQSGNVASLEHWSHSALISVDILPFVNTWLFQRDVVWLAFHIGIMKVPLRPSQMTDKRVSLSSFLPRYRVVLTAEPSAQVIRLVKKACQAYLQRPPFKWIKLKACKEHRPLREGILQESFQSWLWFRHFRKLWEGGGKGHFMSVYLMSENRDATFQLDGLAKYIKTDDEKLHLFLVLQSEKLKYVHLTPGCPTHQRTFPCALACVAGSARDSGDVTYRRSCKTSS